MRIRSLLALAIPLLLLLNSCTPGEADDVPEPPSTPTQTEGNGTGIDLPADGLLSLTTTATAGNGAVLDITLVVHESVAATDAAASDAVAATEAWCAGELDGGILADEGYTLTAVDVTATLTSGEWPAGTSLMLYPDPHPNVVLTATGELIQPPTGSEGEYTPHCATAVNLAGPGTGTFFVGIGGDADGDADGTPPLGGWARLTYGVYVGLPDGTVADVTFTECTAHISELGGGMTPAWTGHFDDPLACAISGGMA
ncbi:MAG: hypothetical protein ABI566_03250 [Pseudolysinimonas sp.]